jgi:S-adenosylmethionine:tRNA ribosyltransferase-isomerase
MLTSDFDYQLPRELIAQHPSEKREGCRMMVLDRTARTREHRIFSDLPQYLRPGDLLVLNDTRVFPARLEGHWADTPGKVEIFLLEPLSGENEWEALTRSGRPFREGNVAVFGGGVLRATLLRRVAGEEAFRAGLRDPGGDAGVQNHGTVAVRLEFAGDLYPLLERCGETPLPPYISRQPAAMTEEERRADAERYQTVYAERTGAVAAPTAGLHFSKEMLASIEASGIEIAKITLHVGPGTFRPVTVENPDDHPMHSERYEVPAAAADAINRCRARGGRIVCVGSTTVRTLETMAAEHGERAVPCSGRSVLFIREPYRFVFTDAMITNFHLPKSTLLMMVAALAGREFVLESYREAVERGYRFFSYGDCMFIV